MKRIVPLSDDFLFVYARSFRTGGNRENGERSKPLFSPFPPVQNLYGWVAAMGRVVILLVAVLTFATSVRAELVSQRWAGGGVPATHGKTISVVKDADGVRLVIDLSAVPSGATVVHASLFCFTIGDVQPTELARIVPPGGEPLELEAPWFRSFDTTDAVHAAKGELVLDVERFDNWDPSKTYLDIRYEGTAGKVPEQVTGVRVAHHDGQTFVMWTELPAFRPAKDKILWVARFASGQKDEQVADCPGVGHMGKPNLPAITNKTLRDLQGLDSKNAGRGVDVFRVREVPPVMYRIYRHSRPITAANLKDAELLGEKEPLSAYDGDMRRTYYRGEFLNQREIPESLIGTWCYDDYKPVMPGEGLFVHTPAESGKRYYAVTSVLAGTENASQIGSANSLAAPIDEARGTPRPVLQRIQLNNFRPETPEYWHILWPAPPRANLPGRPYHIVVTAPPKFTEGDPMDIVGFQRGFNMVNHNVKIPPDDALKLFVESQIGYFDSLCFSNGRGTLKSFRESRVGFFPEQYLLTMIRWCQDKWKPQRSGLYGTFMHFGVRHPEIFGYLSFGQYTAAYNYQWTRGSASLPRYLGPRELAVTAGGESGWEMFNLGYYLKKHPERDIPYMFLISGTGKTGGHTAEFGWQDDPRGWAALRDARQPFVAYWAGFRRDGEQYQAIQNGITWGKSLPAFANCSLDNNPGSGDPNDGDPYGQINGWLLWDSVDVVDEPIRWEMTVYVTGDCMENNCTVDVTPRHLKQFKPTAGQTFKWTNTTLADGKTIGSGTVKTDKWGLITLDQVTVTKGRNRLKITK